MYVCVYIYIYIDMYTTTTTTINNNNNNNNNNDKNPPGRTAPSGRWGAPVSPRAARPLERWRGRRPRPYSIVYDIMLYHIICYNIL